MPKPWVSVQEVATHLGVAKDSVYRWIENKGLPASKKYAVSGNASSLSKDSVAPRVTAYFTQLGVSASPQQIDGECFQAFLANQANSRGSASASRALRSAICRALAKSSSTSETRWSTRPTSISLFTGLGSIMSFSHIPVLPHRDPELYLPENWRLMDSIRLRLTPKS